MAFRLWIKTVVGLDIHIFHTLLLRSWSVLAGGVSILLIPIFLSPTAQGFYYTFVSVLALQVFFELGLNQVTIQLVSNEAAHLTIHEDGTASGDEGRVQRIRGLVELLRRWYGFAAALFFALAGIAGWLFFLSRGEGLPTEEWTPIWFTLVLFTSVNLLLSPLLAVIEGTGKVSAVAQLRLRQSMAGYGLMWSLLLLDSGLWAAIAAPAVSAITTPLWLRRRGGLLKQQAEGQATKLRPISWRQDVFPLQWRIAVSWACGYIIFSLFTPIVFATHGAIEAGRLGMAMTVFSAITTLGLSWINAKAPNLTMHISRGEPEALQRLFKATALRSVIAAALPSFTIVALVALGNHYDMTMMKRIAPVDILFWIALATTVNVGVNAAAVFMRAHLEEPMLPVSALSALLTLSLIALLKDNVSHMMLGYAAISSCISLPWTFLLLRRYLALNHLQPRPNA